MNAWRALASKGHGPQQKACKLLTQWWCFKDLVYLSSACFCTSSSSNRRVPFLAFRACLGRAWHRQSLFLPTPNALRRHGFAVWWWLPVDMRRPGLLLPCCVSIASFGSDPHQNIEGSACESHALWGRSRKPTFCGPLPSTLSPRIM